MIIARSNTTVAYTSIACTNMAVAHPFRVPKNPCTIDIISDPVSPWCFIAKKNLDLALQEADHLYEFELRWHPFQTDPDIPKEGIDKKKHSEEKHGLAQISETVEMRIGDVSSQ